MHGLRKDLVQAEKVCAVAKAGGAGDAEVVICLPATLLVAAAPICANAGVGLGGQHCHSEPSGPFTGDISAEMLEDAGATYVILGHSERRSGHNEGNESVHDKAKAAFRAGLTAIVCVGETRAEREAGDALPVVGAQLAGSIPKASTPESLVIAYEPVWAIGTGLTPTLKDIAGMHRFIRECLEDHLPGLSGRMRILYGGSVKPGNAAELMDVADVDGALVGGASLTAEDFTAIAGVFQHLRRAG
jgi:triosephosphate isomerase